MIDNNQIQTALFDMLDSAALGYPIAWPGVDFTPPDSGLWLEVSFFPNEPMQDGIGDGASAAPRGNFQIAAADRPGAGVVNVTDLATTVAGIYPKGTVIVDPVRVRLTPYQLQLVKMDDRLMIPVTIPYGA